MFFLKRVDFVEGGSLNLGPDATVVIVGPNNSGKTRTLRDIRAVLSEKSRGPLVENVEYEVVDSVDAIVRDLGARSLRPGDQHRRDDSALPESEMRKCVAALMKGSKDYPYHFDRLIERLVNIQTAVSRIKSTEVSSLEDSYPSPLEVLIDDRREAEINAHVKEAFGQEVIVPRAPAARLQCHFGTRPALGGQLDRASTEYVREIKKLPLLAEQGDGVRSYVATLSALITQTHPVLMLDEPEAFLHPPQERLIARKVLRRGGGQQVFLATHSARFLTELLKEASLTGGELHVVHLRRPEGQNTHAHIIDANSLIALAADGATRASSVLEGLFHRLVVLVEGDSDARLFGELAALIGGDLKADCHITSVGGKASFAKVVELLRAIAVPFRAIADADLLMNRAHCLPLLRDVDRGRFESKHREFANIVNAPGALPAMSQVRNEVAAVLHDKAALTNATLQAVKRSLEKYTGTRMLLKHAGLAGLPAGTAVNLARDLLDMLASGGVFVIESGELESLDRSIPLEGDEWVRAVLERGVTSPAMVAARELMTKVLGVSIYEKGWVRPPRQAIRRRLSKVRGFLNSRGASGVSAVLTDILAFLGAIALTTVVAAWIA